MGGSVSKASVLPLEPSHETLHTMDPSTSAPAAGMQLGSHPYPKVTTLEQLSNAYKEGTASRVLSKVAMAGALGFVLGPFAHNGPVLSSAIVSGANAVAVVGFYDVLREALTSLTLSDTPILSLVAGGLTGYVWNGMVHQTRPQAVGGAMVVGCIAAVTHAVLPEFDAHKFALSVLLDTESIQDSQDGALRAQADSPPVLAPYSHSEAKSYIFGLLSQVSPVRKISDEEFEEIKVRNPAIISSRRRVLPADDEQPGRNAGA